MNNYKLCSEWLEFLPLRDMSELSSTERQAFTTHLDSCSQCRDACEKYQRIALLLHTLPSVDPLPESARQLIRLKSKSSHRFFSRPVTLEEHVLAQECRNDLGVWAAATSFAKASRFLASFCGAVLVSQGKRGVRQSQENFDLGTLTAVRRSLELPQKGLPPCAPQEGRINLAHNRYIVLLWSVILCFVSLLSGEWLVVVQQRQEIPSIAHASPVAVANNMYWTGVATNGVQFGFDAAHTHSNPYERVLNTANVTRITPLWSFTTDANIFSSPAVANGMVYVGSDDGNLYAFDAMCRISCRPLWPFLTGESIQSSPAVANGIVYVGSDGGKLYAFDATCRQGCQPLWSFLTGSQIHSSPAVANGMVYVGSDDGKLYAFDASCRSSCQPLWSFLTGSQIHSSPAVANGMVYVGSDDGKLYAFDATCRNDCQPLRSFTVGGGIESSPAVADGMVYVGSDDGKLYAFDATCRNDCQPLWSFATGNTIKSSPTVANSVVYVGSDDGKLYAFDATCRNDCQPLWSFTTGNTIKSSPTVANSVVYVGSDDGKLYAFDANCRNDCQPLRSFTVGGGIESSPAVADGVVYVGSNDHKLYAFGLPISS